MTPAEDSEQPDAESGKRTSSASRKAAWILPLFVAALLITGVVLIYSGITDKQHESSVLARHALATASNAQREINGNRAMLYAVCEAFRRRDLSDAHKWHAVTDIEQKYQRPNNNSLDAAYHAARRKAMVDAERADAQILGFDCLEGMERAYIQGAHSNAPAKATH